VVEVGSYAGGFLAAAAEWGWRTIGTDIGRDTVGFCQSRGLDVRRLHLEECDLAAESLDGVFVWNCFEQLPDPCDLLAEAARVLRVGGLLVLRVPDAGFYLQWQQQYERASSDLALTVLAYNGVLGWPHRFGYGIRSLHRLVKEWPFVVCRALRRPVIRPLRQAMWPWAQDEEAAVIRGETCGWIELAFRKHHRPRS
jgi:SAM-dependent methyltransferase